MLSEEELDLVQTEELVAALFRRCAVGVVLLTEHRSEDQDYEATAHVGNESFCLGMCEAMAQKLRLMISNDFMNQMEEE